VASTFAKQHNQEHPKNHHMMFLPIVYFRNQPPATLLQYFLKVLLLSPHL